MSLISQSLHPFSFLFCLLCPLHPTPACLLTSVCDCFLQPLVSCFVLFSSSVLEDSFVSAIVVCLFCLRSVLLVWLVFSGFSYTPFFPSFFPCSIMSLIPMYRSGWRYIHGPSLCIYHSILSAKDNFFSQICLLHDNSRCNDTNNINLSATDCHGAMIAISRGLKSSEATFELKLEATEPPSAVVYTVCLHK